MDGAEMFLQVAFTRTILDGAPSLLAVLSDATELKTLEAQFVQSQKMQAVGPARRRRSRTTSTTCSPRSTATATCS
jgi:hypothetical protein